MAKLTAALLIVFLIEVSLYFFVGLGNADVAGSFTEKTSLFAFLSSPEAYANNAFYIGLIAVLSLAALATIIPGSFYQVNQWALFAAAAAFMISFIGSIAHLWAFINGQLVGMFSNTEMGGLIAALITAPLLIFYLISVLEWSRQN